MGLFKLDDVSVRTPGEGRYWVAPNAVVLGNVHIGEDASVWFNAVIRGDNEPIRIGEGSNIQDGCVLHADPGAPITLARNVSVGHMAMLHGCTVGEGSLIGIKSVVLNHARIGRNCLIGANTLIAENKVIPDGKLVLGSPGKVVRDLTAEEIRYVHEIALHYQERARRYRAGLRPDGN